MADIELVIKIHEEDYNTIKEFGFNGYTDQTNRIVEIITNGIPLPKGHGDLKDMNDLCYKSRYGCKGNCDYLHTCDSYGAPTIVEADKAESEE